MKVKCCGTKSERESPGLRCATPRGVAQRSPGDSLRKRPDAPDVMTRTQKCKTNPFLTFMSLPYSDQRVTTHARARSPRIDAPKCPKMHHACHDIRTCADAFDGTRPQAPVSCPFLNPEGDLRTCPTPPSCLPSRSLFASRCPA